LPVHHVEDILLTSMRLLLVIGIALLATGCGGDARSGPAGDPPVAATATPAATSAAARAHGRPRSRVVVRATRFRYAGATKRVLTIRANGRVVIAEPSGGAGGVRREARIAPATLRAVRRLVRATPWRRLTRHRRRLDGSGGYFFVRHDGQEHVAMSSGMSADLLPLVRRLNHVMAGDGLRDVRVTHQFFQHS
jgi:hypothetical protein